VPHDAPPNRFVAIVPNTLSLIRLALAVAFPAIPPVWRLPAVVCAGLTDWLDGFVARRWHAGSTSGQLLDAAADKLFVLSVLVTLTAGGLLAWWQAVLVVARDLSVAVVTLHVALRRKWGSFHKLVPRLAGKLTTAFQFALFAVLLLWGDGTGAIVVFAVTAMCSVVAAADYLGQFVRALREDARKG
jgi:CDP-diacylglycerol--glycerol-3-phosphate 3-phosphatidyltransferase